MTRSTGTPKAMRIVMWLPGLSEHGGIARHNRAFCRVVSTYARAHHARVSVVSLRDPVGFYDQSYLTEPLVGCEGVSWRFGFAALASLKESFDLLVVGVADFGPLVPAAWLRDRSAPILTITHGIEVWKPLTWLTRQALTRASAITSVSDYTAAAIVRMHRVERSRIHVIPPSLEPRFALAAQEDGTTPMPQRLLTVSRLNAIDAPKGVERVIEALPAVRERVPTVDYTIVGTGDDRPRLEALAEQHGVADITTFAGAVPDATLHSYLRWTDLFVLPSAKEGFGIAFLEAGAYGKAAIGGNAGGTPEVVIDGETGVLVDPANVEQLADAISTLLLDDERRSELGERGAARISSEYGYELFEERTLAVLDQLLLTQTSTDAAIR